MKPVDLLAFNLKLMLLLPLALFATAAVFVLGMFVGRGPERDCDSPVPDDYPTRLKTFTLHEEALGQGLPVGSGTHVDFSVRISDPTTDELWYEHRHVSPYCMRSAREMTYHGVRILLLGLGAGGKRVASFRGRELPGSRHQIYQLDRYGQPLKQWHHQADQPAKVAVEVHQVAKPRHYRRWVGPGFVIRGGLPIDRGS